MKTLKGFLSALRRNPIYADGFSNREDVFGNFAKAEDSDIIICYAYYDTSQAYEGSAMVLYYKKSTKKYYQAYGSHCSCYGLEDQWEGDEEITVQEIEHRFSKGHFSDGDILKDAFQKYLE